ncbi:hypothetical protein ACFX13_017343 [Malus domestica]
MFRVEFECFFLCLVCGLLKKNKAMSPGEGRLVCTCKFASLHLLNDAFNGSWHSEELKLNLLLLSPSPPNDDDIVDEN